MVLVFEKTCRNSSKHPTERRSGEKQVQKILSQEYENLES